MLLTPWLSGMNPHSLPELQTFIRHNRRHRRRRDNVLAWVETLESRLVLSVTTGFSTAGGTLQINADNNDDITVTVDSSNRVLVNGLFVDNGGLPLLAIDTQLAVLDVRATGNSSNVINLSGVTINAVQHPLIVRVNAGGGADMITGSEFADRLDGGGGLDRLHGGDGNDILINGFDSDGQVGDDLIVINTPLNTLSPTDISLRAEMIRLGADLRTAGGKVSLFGNVVLMNDVIIATGSGSGGSVLIDGAVDSSSAYTLKTTSLSYADAKDQAPLDVPGGYLVTIRSQAEQDAVQTIVGANDVWIAASDADVEGRWEWDAGPDDGVQFWEGDSNGTAVDFQYSNWASGEPNNSGNVENAAQLIGSDLADPGRWNDKDANLSFPYVVESQFSLSLNAGTATVNLNGPVGNISPLRSLSVAAGLTQVTGGSIRTTKSQSFTTALSLTGPTLLRAEEVDFNGDAGSVTGSGTSMLTLAPIKRNAAIKVGAESETPGDASFDITDSDIAALGVGFETILIGEPPPPLGLGGGLGFQVQSTGPVTITGATFSNSVLIAGGSISVTGLNAGTNTVELRAAGGAISDGGDLVTDIVAGSLSLDSSTGVGLLSPFGALETSVTAVSALAAMSGGVFLNNTGNLTIGVNSAPGGIFTDNAPIAVSTTGSLTVNKAIVSKGGDVSLTAVNGIAINEVPIDTAASEEVGGQFTEVGGQFTADADSNNDGSGTFVITSFKEFVDWNATTRQGTLSGETTVQISVRSTASTTVQNSGGAAHFGDPSIYSPVQTSGGFVETHFAQQFETVEFDFSKPQFGLFLHFDGIQYQDMVSFQGTPLPIDLYSLDSTPTNATISKVSGDLEWDVSGNSIQQIGGNATADLDGTVRFDGGVSSLTLSRTAVGVSSGADSIVNVQLGLFRAGGVKTGNNAIMIRAADVSLNGFLDADTNTVSFIPSQTNRPINLGTETVGSLSLTDAELDRVRAGTLLIGDEASGTITISNSISITRQTPTDITLTTGGNNDIHFTGTTGTLDANNGNVSLMLNPSGSGAIISGGAMEDIRAVVVTISAGSGGVGESLNPLAINADFLNSSTSGNGDQVISEVNKVNDLTIGTSGLNAGTGTIHLDSGVFKLDGSDRINDGTVLSVGPSATFQLNGFAETLGGLSDSGSVINGSSTAGGLTINNAGDFEFSGTLGGAGNLGNDFSLTKSGNGSLTLSGMSTFTGVTAINGGTLFVNGSTISATTVANGATLGGDGQIDGSVTVNIGGRVAPGNSPGILRTGDITFVSGSTLDVEVNGNSPGDSHDQLDVTGSVMLGGATLSLSGMINSLPGQQIVIINNDDDDPVIGLFNGVEEGSIVTINSDNGSVTFIVSYAGGVGGNDVTLTQSGGTVTLNDLDPLTADFWSVRRVGDYIQVLNGGSIVDSRPSAAGTAVIINGGSGNDTLDASGFNLAVTLNGGDGADSIIGGSGNDSLIGGDGGDTVDGRNGFDSILGGNGDDSLLGGNDNDAIDGQAGNDTIDGQAGSDLIGDNDGDPSVVTPQQGANLFREFEQQILDQKALTGFDSLEVLALLQQLAEQTAQALGLTDYLVIVVDPVDFLVTDPEGRQAGFTAGTGLVNNIPGSYYSGNGAVELLIVPLPVEGTYSLLFAGLGGPFNVAIASSSGSETQSTVVSQSLSDGANLQVSINVGGPSAIPVGLGLGGNGGTGGFVAFGVVGGDDELARNDAAAKVTEDLISSLELALDESNLSPFDQLVNWIRSAQATREKIVRDLFESLDLPFGNLLDSDAEAGSKLTEQLIELFWKRLGQSLTGVPAGAFRVGDMLESLLLKNSSRSSNKTPTERGKNDSGTNGKATPKTKRSTETRPRTVPRSSEKMKNDPQPVRS